MTAYIALLRAVNVGGTGALAMSELKDLCEQAGFEHVKTYIASGNVVFTSALSEPKVKGLLEKALHAHVGKPVGVMVRTAAEMVGVLQKNPFPEAPGKYTVAIFLDDAPARDALKAARGRVDEEMALGAREVYVFYRSGQGKSKLKIPAGENGTGRNMNTVAKLAEMAQALK